QRAAGKILAPAAEIGEAVVLLGHAFRPARHAIAHARTAPMPPVDRRATAAIWRTSTRSGSPAPPLAARSAVAGLRLRNGHGIKSCQTNFCLTSCTKDGAGPTPPGRLLGGFAMPLSVSTHRKVGSTALELPVFGFGSAHLGELYARVDETTSQATLNAAWDAGVRYYDTAPWYGRGLSEHRVGGFLRTRPRQQFHITTKVGRT